MQAQQSEHALHGQMILVPLRESSMMKRPEWYDVLEPREAVIAGIAGVAVVWPLIYYAYHAGYVFWGYSPRQWKDFGTAIDVLAFAVPYCLVNGWCNGNKLGQNWMDWSETVRRAAVLAEEKGYITFDQLNG